MEGTAMDNSVKDSFIAKFIALPSCNYYATPQSLEVFQKLQAFGRKQPIGERKCQKKQRS